MCPDAIDMMVREIRRLLKCVQTEIFMFLYCNMSMECLGHDSVVIIMLVEVRSEFQYKTTIKKTLTSCMIQPQVTLCKVT